MSLLRRRWLIAALTALALALVACEDAGEGDASEEETEGAEEGAEDEEGADDGAEDDGAEDDGAEDDTAEEDLEPAEGETIMDALREREADEEALAEYEEEAEAAAEDEDAEMPEEPDPSYDTFREAIEDVELTELLESEGPYTVLAPTDAAFSILPEDSVEELLGDTERLERVIRYHIIEDELAADDLADGDTLQTLAGEELTVREAEGGDITVGGVELVEPDVQTDNGVMHGVSAVLLPPPE